MDNIDKPPRVTVAEVRKMRAAAAQVAAPEVSDVSRQGAIAMLAPELLEMRAKGHTWGSITEWLKGQGISVRAATVQTVVNHFRPAAEESAHALRASAARAVTSPVSRRVPPRAAAAPPAVRGAAVQSASETGGATTAAPATARPKTAERAPDDTTRGRGGFVIRPDTPDL